MSKISKNADKERKDSFGSDRSTDRLKEAEIKRREEQLQVASSLEAIKDKEGEYEEFKKHIMQTQQEKQDHIKANCIVKPKEFKDVEEEVVNFYDLLKNAGKLVKNEDFYSKVANYKFKQCPNFEVGDVEQVELLAEENDS